MTRRAPPSSPSLHSMPLTTTRLSNQIGTLKNIETLVQLGARHQLIHALTRAPNPLIKSISARYHVPKDAGGRRPRSLPSLLETATTHLDASVFLKHYTGILRLYEDIRTAIHADAFIRALCLTRASKPDFSLTPDHGAFIATEWHAGRINLSDCRVCHAQYMATNTPTLVRTHVLKGHCPACRLLMSSKTARVPIRIRDIATQRAMFSRLVDGT